MGVHAPAHIAHGGFVHGRSDRGEVRGDVVFEAVFADVVQQLLQPRNFHYARAAEGFEGIVGEVPAAGVAANVAASIVGRKARKTHRSCLHPTDASAEGVVLAHRAGNDLLKIHAHVLEKCLGRLLQWKQTALFGSLP